MGEPVAKIPMVLDSNLRINEGACSDLSKLLENYSEANYNSLAILQTNFMTLVGTFKSN